MSENFQLHLLKCWYSECYYNQNISVRGLFLDAKLNFSEIKVKKAVKGIIVIKEINVTSPRCSLLTIYKLFIRPHLDYGNMIYDSMTNPIIMNYQNYTKELKRLAG